MIGSVCLLSIVHHILVSYQSYSIFKVGFECGFDEVFYVETLNTLMQNEQHNLAAAKSLRPL